MKKSKISIIQISRLVIQIIFLILLPSLYINAFAGIKEIYIAIVKQNISFSQLIPQLIEVGVVVPFTIIMGRFFCGWMCAFGAFGDFIYKLTNKVFKINVKMNEKVDRVLKYFKYVLLAFLIIIIFSFNINTFSTFSPWDAFGMLVSFGKLPALSYVALNLTTGFLTFIFISIASMVVERFFCRYLCPLGAVFAVTSKLKIAKIQKERSKCGKCRICTNNCAMGIPLYNYDVVKSGECINCMQCINKCPRKNVTLTVSGEDVRPLVAGAAAVSIMTGLFYAGSVGVNAAGLDNTQIVTQGSQTAVNPMYKDGTEVSNNQSQIGASVSGNSNTENTSSNTLTSNLQQKTNSQSASVDSTASSTAKYKDGTYEGSGTGFRGGTTTVSVVIKDGQIADVSTVSYDDDRPFYSRAFSTIAQEITSTQTPNVDSVSGATFSSMGIMEAVANALNNAV